MTTIRRARAATTVVFFLVGCVYSAWGTRVPAIKEQLDLSDGQLGLAILGLEGGAIVGLPVGGALVARLRSRVALRLGFVGYPVALVLAALASDLTALAGCLGLMAAASSIIDVAMNAQGVELERRYERPILSGLHAGHPFGLVVGGVVGALAASAGVSVAVHFVVVAGVGLVAGIGATWFLVREPAVDGQGSFVLPRGRLLLLGVVAFFTFLLDGAAYNWAAVHLHSERHAPAGSAAMAFTLFSLTLAGGRLFGDRLVARFGRVRVVQGGGAVAAVGSLVAITSPTVPMTLAGWAIFGLGLAPLAPTVLGAAAQVSRVPPGVAIAAVTTIGYLGSFTGPPAIGGVAQVTGLSVALVLLTVVSILLLFAASPALRDVRRR
jgi:MFS family permease